MVYNLFCKLGEHNMPNTPTSIGGSDNSMVINSVADDKNLENKKAAKNVEIDQDDVDDFADEKPLDRFASDGDDFSAQELDLNNAAGFLGEEEDFNFDAVENILELPENEFPKFTLAKNKARFLRMVSWYRQKEEWIEVAPLSGVTKLFKQQSKELEGIRASKMDYEMELETGTLTPSQRSYRKDELKMCRVQEKMAVHLIAKLQLKIKSGRR